MAVVAAVVLVAAAAFAAVASGAGVATVYKNTFTSANSAKTFKKAGGAACTRGYNSKKNLLLLNVTSGKANCPWTLPVYGDTHSPSHEIRYKGKILKTTKGANVRKRAFLVSNLRVGNDVRYELRIFPRQRRYQLVRFPSSGQFPIAGKDNRVKKIGQTNTVMFRIFQSRIQVNINGTKFIDVVDDNPTHVEGNRIQIGAGSGTSTKKPVKAAFSEVRVSVPSP